MKPVLQAISLVVDDLARATTFYRDAWGSATQGLAAGVEDQVYLSY